VDEAAHGVDVDITIGRVMLDMRRVGKQYQLYSHPPLGSPAGKLLDIL